MNRRNWTVADRGQSTPQPINREHHPRTTTTAPQRQRRTPTAAVPAGVSTVDPTADTVVLLLPARPDTFVGTAPAPVIPSPSRPLDDQPPTPAPTPTPAPEPPRRRADDHAESWRLVDRTQAGDPEAFGQLYDRYCDVVLRFCFYRCGNRQLAEDLTQETFLRALKRISSVTYQGTDFGAWLVTIARNLLADHFKSGRYRLEVITGDVLDPTKADPDAGPGDQAATHERNLVILRAVQQLMPEQQECIRLRFLLGLSVAETAAAMGKQVGAIKALQYRAVRAMRRVLPDPWPFDR